jgi:O-antigen/teichoic acid export membrane protein
MAQKQSLTQDTVIVFVLFLAAALFSYIFKLILARNLSLKDYGLFFAVVAFLGIINIFRDLGIGQSAMYYLPRFVAGKQQSKVREFIDKIARVELLTSMIAMIAIIALADFLAQNYFHYGSVSTIMLFAIAYFFNSVEINIQTLFNVFQSQKLYALHNLTRTFIVMVLALYATMTLYKSNVNTYVIVEIVAYLTVAVVFGVILYHKLYPKRINVKKETIPLKNLFVFGLIATGAQLCYFFITTTDTIFLTYMTTLENVGLYNAVIPLVTLLLYFTMSLSAVITPRISELTARKKFSEIRFLWQKSIKYVLIATLPFIGLLVLYPSLILRMMFGVQFVAASTTLAIMGSGIILFGLSQINMGFLLSIVGPKKNLIIFAVATVANVILNLILIPKYSIEGAATATVISYGLLFIMSTYYLLKVIKTKINIAELIMILIPALFYILSVKYLKYLIDLSPILEIIIIFLISGAIYVLLLFLLRAINFREIDDIRKAIFRR